jgi:hypothetical protein
MKGIMLTTRNLEWVYLPGRAGTSIKAVTRTMRETDTERCFGLMAAATKANGLMVFSTAWEGSSSRMGGLNRVCLKTTFLSLRKHHSKKLRKF